MKIDDLEGRMRSFEAVLDPTVLPGVFMVARLDGRNFTRLTKELHPFEAPFDRRFHDHMLRTTEHLMGGCERIIRRQIVGLEPRQRMPRASGSSSISGSRSTSPGGSRRSRAAL